MRNSVSVLAVLLVLTTSAARADDSAPSGDLAKIQGRWTGKFGKDNDISVAFEIKGNEVSGHFTNKDGEDVSLKGEVKLDESAKPHKAVDWVKFTGRDGQELPANLGIYSIEGDEFKVCNGGPNNPRPTEFKAGENGEQPQLIILKREKAASADASKGDLAKLQGKWSAMVGPEKNIPLVVVFKGNSASFKLTVQGEEREFAGEIKLDESAKPHKTIDWVKFKRPNGEDAPENLGIYEFDGKDLKICNGGPGNERPTEFKPGDDDHPRLIILKKERGD